MFFDNLLFFVLSPFKPKIKQHANYICSDGHRFISYHDSLIHQSYIDGNRKNHIIIWEMINNVSLAQFLTNNYPLPMIELKELIERNNENLKKVPFDALLEKWKKKSYDPDPIIKSQYRFMVQIVDELKNQENPTSLKKI